MFTEISIKQKRLGQFEETLEVLVAPGRPAEKCEYFCEKLKGFRVSILAQDLNAAAWLKCLV